MSLEIQEKVEVEIWIRRKIFSYVFGFLLFIFFSLNVPFITESATDTLTVTIVSPPSSSEPPTLSAIGGGGPLFTTKAATKFRVISGKADMNNDSRIGLLDFNILMANWGETIVGNIADINNDGVVDILDFNLLMIHWSR